MTLLDITTPHTEPPRDRWQRPLITPVGGGKPIPYTRTTTYAGTCEDTYNLSKWQQRMVAVGLASREDLLLSTAAHRDDRDKLNKLCDQAIEAAKGGAAAVTGTALHTFSDQLDRGQLDLNTVPASHRADLEAFAAATSCLRVEAIEAFGVLDDLQVAGTADRIYRYRSRIFIGDTKSGSIDWGQQKIAMQLAIYSRMTLYDPATGERGHDLSKIVDQRRAIVVHLPAGTGRAELMWVDIHAGWKNVPLARQVRDWRATKGLITPFGTAGDESDADLLSMAITGAESIDALDAVWSANRSVWTDLHTDLARSRKAQLTPAQT